MIRGASHFIATEYTKAMVEEGKDARALHATAGRQALVAVKTETAMQQSANEKALMAKGVKVAKQVFDAIKQVVMMLMGAASGGGGGGGADAAKMQDGGQPEPELPPEGPEIDQGEPEQAPDAGPADDAPNGSPSAKSQSERLEEFVRGRYLVDTPEEAKAKLAEKLEEKFFEVLAGPGEDGKRDAQRQRQVVQASVATEKRASQLAHGHRLDAQRLVDMHTRRPADL